MNTIITQCEIRTLFRRCKFQSRKLCKLFTSFLAIRSAYPYFRIGKPNFFDVDVSHSLILGFVKKFVPMFCNNFLVFLYYRFHEFNFRRLQTIVIYQGNRKQGEFGTDITFGYMDMDRFMVIRIKQEAKTE